MMRPASASVESASSVVGDQTYRLLTRLEPLRFPAQYVVSIDRCSGRQIGRRRASPCRHRDRMTSIGISSSWPISALRRVGAVSSGARLVAKIWTSTSSVSVPPGRIGDGERQHIVAGRFEIDIPNDGSRFRIELESVWTCSGEGVDEWFAVAIAGVDGKERLFAFTTEQFRQRRKDRWLI